MRRFGYLIFIMMLFCSANVFCQRGTTFGIDGSFNNTWIGWLNAYGIEDFKNTKMSYYKPSYGSDFSLSVGQNFVDILGVKAEIGINTLNQKYDNTVANTTRDLQLKYLEIPVMLRLSSQGEKFMLHFLIGPQFGFLMGANQTNITGINVNTFSIKDSEGNTIYPFKDKDIKDRYNKVDILGVFEVGGDVYLTDNLLLNIGIRIHGSLKDINKTDWQFKNSPDVDYYKSKNFYGGLNVGLTYALKNWYLQH